MSASLRVLKDMTKRGLDTSGYVSHLTVIADKVETRFYRSESIIAYDKAVRTAAALDGIQVFATVDFTLVMQHGF